MKIMQLGTIFACNFYLHGGNFAIVNPSLNDVVALLRHCYVVDICCLSLIYCFIIYIKV